MENDQGLNRTAEPASAHESLIAQARAAIQHIDVARATCVARARTVPCPACEAPPGRPCRTRGRYRGNPLQRRYSQAHPAREEAADLVPNGWWAPPTV